jgi:hypothetical protein
MTETMYFPYPRLLVITIAGTASLGETFVSRITQHATDGYYKNILPYRIILNRKTHQIRRRRRADNHLTTKTPLVFMERDEPTLF